MIKLNVAVVFVMAMLMVVVVNLCVMGMLNAVVVVEGIAVA